MPLDPSIPLQARSPNLMQALMSGFQAGQAIRQAPLMESLLQQRVTAGEQAQAAEAQRQAQAQAQARMSGMQFEQQQALQRAQYANSLARQLKTVPFEDRSQIIRQNSSTLQSFGIDPSQLDPTDENLDQTILGTDPFLAQAGPATAAEREFEMLTQDLTPEEIEQAKRIELGLEPRAQAGAARTLDIGGVPHVFDPATRTFVRAIVSGEEVTPERVGEAEAVIAARKETGKRQAEISAKVVDKSFERIGKVNRNISNIDKAISALDRGARTGAVQRFLPSITAASRELEQIRNELGLDVIGDVTFGALSEGELKLALDTALPTGLDESQLKDFLQRKRAAQVQLRTSLEDAAKFLSVPENTVAGFIESKQEAPKRLRFNPSTGRLE